MSAHSNPVGIHVSVLGANVLISEEAQRSLEIDWEQGTVITTAEVLGRAHVQVLNEKTGQITKPVKMEDIRFSPEELAARAKMRAFGATLCKKDDG